MRIATLLLALISPLAAAIEETVSGDLGAQLDEYLTGVEATGMSGAFLVAKDGEIALAKGYGLADRARDIPVTTETVFTIGSITKQFTGAAILKLEEAGKLSVEDSIREHLKGVPRSKKDVTLHHLLTHTAGLPGAFGGDFVKMTEDDMVEKFASFNLLAEPGERHQYSNPGYSLLGIVVGRVSEKGYEGFLHEAFFEPLGMNDTGYLMPGWEEDRVAHGYTENGEDWGTLQDKTWGDDGPYWNLRANGGIMSTIGDMYTWHVALTNDSVLSNASREKFFAPHVSEGEGSGWHYGYGFAIATTERDTKLIAHNGGNGIFFADFRRYVDDDVAIIMMTNAASTWTDDHHRDLRRIVFGYEPLVEVD
jgi:CubicO group peptidase (beta-lactamase class C family)